MFHTLNVVLLHLFFITVVHNHKTIQVQHISGPQYCWNPITTGDKVTLSLSSFAPEAEAFLQQKFGQVLKNVDPTKRRVIQHLVVGQHNISPLNHAMIGMCLNETRRVEIPIFNTKIYYDVKLLKRELSTKQSSYASKFMRDEL